MLLPAALFAQSPTPNDEMMRVVLERLDHLERQNQELIQEVTSLRKQIESNSKIETAPAAESNENLAQRVDVNERRVEEQAQSKVEASQKFPISLTGLVLFNAFANGGAAPPFSPGDPDRFGATFRQTILGFDFHGPDLPGGGKASGELRLDLSGSEGVYGNDYGVSLRRAVINLDWPRRSVTFGQDKPLISAREPDSLAEVLIPPLAYAGNPWLWLPQVRYTERFGLGETSGVNLQASVLETNEDAAYPPNVPTYNLEPSRPALEIRSEFWTDWNGESRLEVAPGFHASTTHIAGYSVPSRFGSFDWRFKLSNRIELKGLVFGGQNMAMLGGFSNGFSVRPWEEPQAVRGIGGWSQVAVHITPRLTWNTFAGTQASRVSDLNPGALTHDFTYASNLMYRLAPNILVGFEALQNRAGYLTEAPAIRNHYDVALGYLF